ncbi:unnamed protein product [Dracunculus medinensis]|uniref:PPM-type phosphatase domain-containing protein n=1 Tax=Dracunculus medinensis TaxID=318479 RepID=A0A0N4UI09_DRAME|nr:unnamed protein product [Dracunculus medinensis]
MECTANERRRIESAGGFIEFKGVERVQGILSVTSQPDKYHAVPSQSSDEYEYDKAFGDTDLKRLCVLTAHPDIVRVDLRQITLRFILVASDGFWDVLSNQKAINLAKKFLAKEPQAHWHKNF